MPLRPCIVCGIPSPASRCPTHARPNSSTARGYGTAHQRARRELAATLPAPCGYGCGLILSPTGAWVAAHVIDGDPDAGWIASCRSCNERAKTGGGRESLRPHRPS